MKLLLSRDALGKGGNRYPLVCLSRMHFGYRTFPLWAEHGKEKSFMAFWNPIQQPKSGKSGENAPKTNLLKERNLGINFQVKSPEMWAKIWSFENRE
jgi:hypothetical protein